MLLSGCAASVALPEGTMLLGEVRQAVTREMLASGKLAPDDVKRDLGRTMAVRGWTEAQLDAGQLVVLRTRVYWHNTASGIVHDELHIERVAEGLQVEPGNIVELQVGPKGSIRAVRARSLAEGRCEYRDVEVGKAVELMGALSLVGPRGSASLYCAGIEHEGWQRPRTYWHKLP